MFGVIVCGELADRLLRHQRMLVIPNPSIQSGRAGSAVPPVTSQRPAADFERCTSTMKCLYALALFLVASCSTVQPSVDVKADLSCRKEKECSCQQLKYPRDSARNREQGLVRLKILVSHDGRARDVVVERSSGYRRLDEAAVEDARRMCFRPAVRNGVPVEVWTNLEYKWVLQ